MLRVSLTRHVLITYLLHFLYLSIIPQCPESSCVVRMQLVWFGHPLFRPPPYYAFLPLVLNKYCDLIVYEDSAIKATTNRNILQALSSDQSIYENFKAREQLADTRFGWFQVAMSSNAKASSQLHIYMQQIDCEPAA